MRPQHWSGPPASRLSRRPGTGGFLRTKWLAGTLKGALPVIMIILLAFPQTGCRTTTMVPAQALLDTSPEETIYAAVLSTRRHTLAGQNPTVGVFFSRDGGATWQHTGWRQGRTFAVMAPVGGRGDTLLTASGNGVHRTMDGGDFWRITTGREVTEVQDITINPVRPEEVYAATPYGIFWTGDLGETWEQRSEGLTSLFVASIRIDRTQPDRVFAGTEDGLFVSDDRGRSWRFAGVRDPIRSIRQSPTNPERWVLGLQERGVAVSTDGGVSWRPASGTLAGRSVYQAEFDPANPDILYAGGWQTGVYRTNDFGTTWQSLTPLWDDTSLNVHSIAVSRRYPGRVFAGTMGGGMYVTHDGGSSWSAVVPEIFDASQVWDLFVEGEQ
jgi:photosystem II stability/assembly factor-like uncharacterized protein